MDGKEAVQVPVEETGLSNRSDKGADPTSEVQLPRSRAKRRQPAVGPAATAAAIAIAGTLLGAGKDARPIYAAGETPTPVATATSNLKVTETAKAQATQVMVGVEARMAAAAATSIARPTQRAQATEQAIAANANTARPVPTHEAPRNDYSWRSLGGLINWQGLIQFLGIGTVIASSIWFVGKGIKWVVGRATNWQKNHPSQDRSRVGVFGREERDWTLPGEIQESPRGAAQNPPVQPVPRP